MRLLFVAPNIRVPGTNGGSTHVTEVVAGLRKRNDVLLAARRLSSGHQTLPIGLGTAYQPFTYPLAAWHAARILPAARRFRPDAIYERYSAQGAGILLGKALGVPVLSMVLDNNATGLTLRNAKRLVTTAPHLVPEEFQDKVVEVSWGANIERFHPDIDASELRASLGYTPEDFVLVYTGAFYNWHGLDVLLEAVAHLEREGRVGNLKLLLVGEGNVREEMEALASELGLKERVRFHPRVPYEEVPRYVALADACTSVYDPPRNPDLAKHGMFLDPLKTFEYMACGKPTLVMDTANMRRLFEDERHALFVKGGDRDSLVIGLERLMNGGGLREKLAQEGRELTVRKHSWQAHADHLSDLFEEMVAGRG